jgi:hypothetical protein
LKKSHEQWGLWCKAIKDWMMESRNEIAVWETEKEAESFRKNHTVHKDMYEVKNIYAK